MHTRFWSQNQKRPHGRLRQSWEDSRIDLREIGWEGVDCSHMAQDKDQWSVLLHMVLNLQVP
jgi:hypothetical protein